MNQGEHRSSNGELLRRLGLRQTPQRLLILSVLQASQTRLSIEEILAQVRERDPGVSATTVYRTLALLERAGVIWRVILPGEGITYQATFSGIGHLLVCQRCRRVVRLSAIWRTSPACCKGSMAFMRCAPLFWRRATATCASSALAIQAEQKAGDWVIGPRWSDSSPGESYSRYGRRRRC